jgi:soluble lytic murein transglycosylase-like protein
MTRSDPLVTSLPAPPHVAPKLRTATWPPAAVSPTAFPGVTFRSQLRAAGTIALLAFFAACTTVPQQDATQEAARYVAHAKRNYTPPGPPEDPWGPYIREASARFDIPDIWIRSLMRVESGGKEYLNGDLITSGAGAMGLMQVMPQTYDELRDRYNLGDDPFDPHDNIMAGVAYMREMYDSTTIWPTSGRCRTKRGTMSR